MARRGAVIVKRKRRGGSACANPLFVRWAEELRDDAIERGLKSHYTYSKAVNSLKRYPLPLKSGEEAKILDNVGDKLAKILDRKLAEYEAAGSGGDSEEDFPGSPPSSSQGRKQNPSKRKKNNSPVDPFGATPPPTPKAKKKSSAREYVPAFRSGPYALVIALHSAREKPSWKGYLHKAELIADAQTFCDASFTVADAGKYYTAWSSMSNIIGKGLVWKRSNPSKFSLTEKGEDMARRLLRGTSISVSQQTSGSQETSSASGSQGSSQPSSSGTGSQKVGKRSKKRSTLSHAQGLSQSSRITATTSLTPPPFQSPSPLSVASSDEELSSFKPPPPKRNVSYVERPPSTIPTDFGESSDEEDSQPQADTSARHDSYFSAAATAGPILPLQFWYVDNAGKPVLKKDEAAVTFNEVVSVGFLVKCKLSDLKSSKVLYTLDECRGTSGPYVYAYISNLDAPDWARPPAPPHSPQGTTSAAGPPSPVSKPTPTGTKSTGKMLKERPAPSAKTAYSRSEVSEKKKVLTPCSESVGPYQEKQKAAGSRGPPQEKRKAAPAPEVINLSDSDEEILPLRSRVGQTLASPPGPGVSCPPVTKVSPPTSFANPRPSSPPRLTSPRSRVSAPSFINPRVSTPSYISPRVSPPSQSVSTGLLHSTPSTSGEGRGRGREGAKVRSRPAATPAARAAGDAALKRWSTIAKHSGSKASEDVPSPPPVVVIGMTPSPPASPKGKSTLTAGGRGAVGVSPPPPTVNPRKNQPGHPAVRPQEPPCRDAKGMSPPPAPPLRAKPQRNGTTGGRGRAAPGGTEGGVVSGRRGGAANEGGVILEDPEFILTPGNFDVVLLVDSSESTASRKSSSQFRGVLLQELGKNGVTFDVRRLSVGDFTWVAREKSFPKPGCLTLPKSREIVLEYIVERKRWDDLAGSICDGRFNEQKFRLKSSAVLHPVYLVEEYGEPTHSTIDVHTLNRAVVNTQIMDGFFVKRTKDIRESVAYLTILTRSLQLAYAGKTVKAYSYEAVSDFNKAAPSKWDLSASIVHGVEFSKFNEASVKNKTLSVQEMFGRHLMQLPGLSADKAAVILARYPTVKSLRDAYSRCVSETERKKMVADLRFGCTKRRLGPSLSGLLFSVYCEGE